MFIENQDVKQLISGMAKFKLLKCLSEIEKNTIETAILVLNLHGNRLPLWDKNHPDSLLANWTNEEDSNLRKEMDAGRPVSKIPQALSRSLPDVLRRLQFLELITAKRAQDESLQGDARAMAICAAMDFSHKPSW